MTIQLNEENGGKLLVVHVSGKLVKADNEHFADIERLAMLGDQKWQHGMAIFCKPFTKAQVRYFDHANTSEARKWPEEA